MGTVAGIEQLGDSIRLRVNATKVVSDVQAGDSICVSGVCLTVIEFDDAGFVADVMQESLDRSALGELVVGAPVNLERAMPVTGRLGGHIIIVLLLVCMLEENSFSIAALARHTAQSDSVYIGA